VLGANVLFRPLARKIDRQPSRASDVETKYVLTLVCRSDDQAKVRILLMHLLHALPLTLHALHSEDLNTSGKVEVRASISHLVPMNPTSLQVAAQERPYKKPRRFTSFR